jgi:hypothetical protein
VSEFFPASSLTPSFPEKLATEYTEEHRKIRKSTEVISYLFGAFGGLKISAS